MNGIVCERGRGHVDFLLLS